MSLMMMMMMMMTNPLVLSLPQRPNLVSLVPDKPIQPVGTWVWGKLVNGFVYRAPQTLGGEGKEFVTLDKKS